MLGFKTRQDQTAEALALTHEILGEYSHAGPSRELFESSIKNIVGGAPMNSDTNIELAQILSTIGFYDMPIDYLDTYSARIQAVTLEQARDAFSQVVTPQTMVTVIVGQDEQS